MNRIKNLNAFRGALFAFSNMLAALGIGFDQNTRDVCDDTAASLTKIAAAIGSNDAKRIVQNFQQTATEKKRGEESPRFFLTSVPTKERKSNIKNSSFTEHKLN
ncbi:hypothetical exported protein [Coxiella burnetii Dugway 5J108-111]|uniref:Hypothetical exported protein n=1 Tax=Coxiella burnetii (strain Dugway 5J108-111) TaxID=434922 RepID=A9KFB6_COXBN|nr:hypothetical exported protein [Coxiella burnetii Dugway 5J108-111]